MNQLGHFIKGKREELGYSLRTLSKKSELSHSYIDKIEKGIDSRSNKEIMPTVHVLYKLSLALNIPLQELIEASGYSINTTNLVDYMRDPKSDYTVTIRIEQQINYLISQLENKNDNLELYSKLLNETSRVLLLESFKNLMELARKMNE